MRHIARFDVSKVLWRRSHAVEPRRGHLLVLEVELPQHAPHDCLIELAGVAPCDKHLTLRGQDLAAKTVTPLASYRGGGCTCEGGVVVAARWVKHRSRGLCAHVSCAHEHVGHGLRLRGAQLPRPPGRLALDDLL